MNPNFCATRRIFLGGAAATLAFFLWAPAGLTREQEDKVPDLMHLTEPADIQWVEPLPQPVIPPPPTNVGLKDPGALRDAEPMFFENEEELAAEAAKENGFVTGSGTEEDPYVIRDLRFTGIDDKPAIEIRRVQKPLLIENVQVIGAPSSDHAPAPAWGIRVVDCVGTTIRHCEVSRCGGMNAAGGHIRDIRFENNYVFSCDRAIMSSGGSHVTAIGNYTRDSAMYGIFLYNGTDHVIENNYVAWAGREGTGSHGQSARLTVRNNVILHTGWTAINVEGYAHDSIAEGNLIVDTHYGIIFMGSRSICRDNQIFHASQDGVHTHGRSDDTITDMVFEDMEITGNLIVGSGETGILVKKFSPNARITNNRIRSSHTGIQTGAPGNIVADNDIQRCMYGITLHSDAAGFTVKDNWIYSGRNGVSVRGIQDPGGRVTGNTLHHTISGIGVKDSSDILIADNSLRSVGSTIRMDDSTGLTVTGNRLIRTGYNNIQLNNCRDCVVEDNFVEAGVVSAVRVNGGGGHKIAKNEISHIQSRFWGAGILLLGGAADNTITGNLIKDTELGIAFSGKAPLRDNILKKNQYVRTDKEIVVQQDAELEAVKAANTLDTEPTGR